MFTQAYARLFAIVCVCAFVTIGNADDQKGDKTPAALDGLGKVRVAKGVKDLVLPEGIELCSDLLKEVKMRAPAAQSIRIPKPAIVIAPKAEVERFFRAESAEDYNTALRRLREKQLTGIPNIANLGDYEVVCFGPKIEANDHVTLKSITRMTRGTNLLMFDLEYTSPQPPTADDTAWYPAYTVPLPTNLKPGRCRIIAVWTCIAEPRALTSPAARTTHTEFTVTKK